MPDEFLAMAWCDYQRHAQGYIIRQCRYLEGIRKTAYWALIAAGAKRVKENRLFTLITDPPAPKIEKEEELSQEELNAIANRYFGSKKKK
jgi:hypothetical protein